VEQFLDFILGVAWWQWLLGTAVVAGTYYSIVGIALERALRARRERKRQEAIAQRQAEELAKERDGIQREHARQERLSRIPSGPVAPVRLAPAFITVENRTLPLRLNAETTLGAGRDNTIAVMKRGVSRHHAKIRPETRGYVLYDLMSLHGTRVGDDRIEIHVLADGDVIRVGPVTIAFRLDGPSDARLRRGGQGRVARDE